MVVEASEHPRTHAFLRRRIVMELVAPTIESNVHVESLVRILPLGLLTRSIGCPFLRHSKIYGHEHVAAVSAAHLWPVDIVVLAPFRIR